MSQPHSFAVEPRSFAQALARYIENTKPHEAERLALIARLEVAYPAATDCLPVVKAA